MYAGLTTADKGALLDAKARGAEWIAREDSSALWGYATKPVNIDLERGFFTWSVNGLSLMLGAIPLDDCKLDFIKWNDAEPVNIDLALAQIAEMESKQKELLSEKASEKGCLTNRDKWMQLWNESDEILARQFVQQEWYGTQWCVYMFSEEPISRHDKWEDAIQAAITALHSPYTEGETK